MNASDWAAWYGAFLATAVFFWEIYKHVADRAYVEVSVTPNMRLVMRQGPAPMEKYVCIEVRNNSEKTTTLTNLACAHYQDTLNGRLRRWFSRSPDDVMVVVKTTGDQLPHVLEPGKRWTGMIPHWDELIKFSQSGTIAFQVYHTGSTKPASAVLKTSVALELKHSS